MLSYVDIVAPEDVSEDELSGALSALVDLVDMPGSFAPLNSRVGFHIDMAASLRTKWQAEVLRLVEYFFAAQP
ncbi:MAG: hypothetical protein ACI8S6_001973 [Myxococcota bacterium]